MATANQVRAWGRAEGREDVPERGPLPKTLTDAYQAAQDDQGAAGAPPEGEPLGAAPPPPPPPPGEGEGSRRQQETRPRNVKGPSAAGRARQAAGRLRTRLGGGGAGARKRSSGKRRRPGGSRVPVTDMIEEAWEQLAWAASPILPLNRILSVQAPFAGVVLEDTVRDTFIDHLLQPAARNEKAARTAMGLLGPPAVIMVMLQTDAGSAQMPWLRGMLRYSLLSWAKSCDLNAEEAIKRAQQHSEASQQVDMLINWIFSAPDTPKPQTVPGEVIPPGQDDQTAARADAEARMRQVFGPGLPGP